MLTNNTPNQQQTNQLNKEARSTGEVKPKITSQQSNKKIIVLGSIAITLTIVGSSLGYFLGKKTTWFSGQKNESSPSVQEQSPKNLTQNSQTDTSSTNFTSPTPPNKYGPVSDWQTYHFPGFSQYQSNEADHVYQAFKISYPHEAELQEIILKDKDPQQLNLTITVNNFDLMIHIGPGSNTTCIYDDSEHNQLQENRISIIKDYRELTIQSTLPNEKEINWRLSLPEKQENQQQPELVICEQDEKNNTYKRQSKVGSIRIRPRNDISSKEILDSTEIKSLIMILESIKVSTPTNPYLLPSPTPIELSQIFTNEYYPYSISYPKNWRFRKTYGEDVVTNSETDIISGFDIINSSGYYTQATVAFNLLASKGKTEINEWIEQYDRSYDPNYPKHTNTIQEIHKIDFNGYPALKYKLEPNSETDPIVRERIYFLKDQYMYRLMYWEKDNIDLTTQKVVNSFQPIN